MLGVKNFAELLGKINDNAAFVVELVPLGLLRLGKCQICRRDSILTHSTNYKGEYCGGCPKCRKQTSLTKGSFFENSHLSLGNIFELSFCLSKGPAVSQKKCVDMTGINRVSVNQFYRFAGDVASWKLIKDEDHFIFGGESIVVQIDESVISKRKYQRGTIVREKWVFGMYDTRLKRGLIVYVPNCKAVALLPIIPRHLRAGTKTWSDEWAAYRQLSQLGYIHKTVNHSKNFKGSITGCCTNQVEGFWTTTKNTFDNNLSRGVSTQKSMLMNTCRGIHSIQM